MKYLLIDTTELGGAKISLTSAYGKEMILTEEETEKVLFNIWKEAQECAHDYDENPDGGLRGMGLENWEQYKKDHL